MSSFAGLFGFRRYRAHGCGCVCAGMRPLACVVVLCASQTAVLHVWGWSWVRLPASLWCVSLPHARAHTHTYTDTHTHLGNGSGERSCRFPTPRRCYCQDRSFRRPGCPHVRAPHTLAARLQASCPVVSSADAAGTVCAGWSPGSGRQRSCRCGSCQSARLRRRRRRRNRRAARFSRRELQPSHRRCCTHQRAQRRPPSFQRPR